MSIRRVASLTIGILLVVTGLAGFLAIDGVTADVVCAIAFVAGLAVMRYGSRPGPQQIV